jgi:hypothetical protein
MPNPAKLEEMDWKDLLWSRRYFAALCGAAPLNIIQQYLERQKHPIKQKGRQSRPCLISLPKLVGFA